MYISPRTVIENGWITHPNCASFEDFKDKKFVSPNAIDFTVDKLFSIASAPFRLSEESKLMRGGSEMNTIDGYWKLNKGAVYDALSDFYVEVPEGVACHFIVRSTLNRNGIFVTSGLYDSGFKGNLGFAIHNRGGVSYIAPGTRVAQIIFTKSDSEGVYEGGYNHEKGTHWSESKNITDEKPKKTTNKKATKKKSESSLNIKTVAKEMEKEVNSVTEKDDIPFGSPLED